MSTYTDASLIVTPNSKKAGKLYALKGADLDVVRATTATYVGSDGLIKTALANELRFDYTNGSCPSILVEPQRTNLLLRSEEFDNASWAKTRATIASNVTTAPDGTLTADKLILSVDNNTHFIQQSGISVTAQIYSATVYAKKAEYDTVRLLLANYWTPTPNVIFNLTTKSIVSTSSATAKITELKDGWFKLDITATINASAGGNAYFSIYGGNNGIVNLVGDGTSGIYIWGAQLEAGSNATSYIPTVASTVTRNADVISKTGISSLIGQTEGTIFADLNFNNSSSKIEVNRIIELTDGTNTNRIIIAFGSVNTLLIRVTANNIEQASFQATSISLGRLKVALSYSTSGVRFFVNGTLRQSNLSATIPSTNRLNIGYQGTSTGSFLTDTINSALVFPTQLTDQQCIALTTL